MTGKFEVADDYLIKYDGDYFDLHKPSDIRSLVTVVNYIVTDNEQLKSREHDLALELNALVDENEQLKQRNNNQYHQLQHLWKLIEAMDWETLTAMVNQMKKDNERLQREWGYYND